MGKGIDYGMGQTNVDHETGIRYGVISMHEITQAWCDSSDSDYGPASCPKCGNEAVDEDTAINAVREEQARSGEPVTDIDDVVFEPLHAGSCADHYCADCGVLFGSDEAYGDEAIGHNLDDGEYKATQGGDDSDVFVLKSPYYTKAAYCSPCAPGACHLAHPDEDGDRAYCFGHDWFEGGVAPYPVYEVATGKLVVAGE
jgi:hypothetical protein